MQNVIHDFTEPDLSGYFGDQDTIQKLDIIHLESMNQFVVYWDEGSDNPINEALQESWGIPYRGKILVFKRRGDAMRFCTMRRYHLDQVIESLKWCANFQ